MVSIHYYGDLLPLHPASVVEVGVVVAAGLHFGMIIVLISETMQLMVERISTTASS